MSYSPTIGRFLQRDPLGYVDGANLYQYVVNDPISAVDPSGNGPTFTPAPWSDAVCSALRGDILHKIGELLKEFAKFDPCLDDAGGPGWKPGGHRIEIQNLQRGLVNDLWDYYMHCGGTGKTPDFSVAWKLAYTPIPECPKTQPQTAPQPAPVPQPQPRWNMLDFIKRFAGSFLSCGE